MRDKIQLQCTSILWEINVRLRIGSVTSGASFGSVQRAHTHTHRMILPEFKLPFSSIFNNLFEAD